MRAHNTLQSLRKAGKGERKFFPVVCVVGPYSKMVEFQKFIGIMFLLSVNFGVDVVSSVEQNWKTFS